MSPRIRSILASIRPRTKLQRIALILLAFCLLNGIWSIIGNWAISFGGESYSYYDRASRHSGIYNSRGYLVIAVRHSSYMGSGLRQAPDSPPRVPTRHPIPWSITADLWIGPNMLAWQRGNGILDNRPRTVFPGVKVNWQPADREWHNRGVAIHWALLTSLAAIAPLVSIIRRRKRAKHGLCATCGYDLRATPDRCPECGTTPAAAGESSHAPGAPNPQ